MMETSEMAPTLVLLHGFTHTGASWSPVIRALGERYSAIAPDIRGHGSATLREPVSIDGVIDDVVRMLPEDQFSLVGYSMGGRIALHVALALSGRVQRLVLVGASPGIADTLERQVREDADERLAEWIDGARDIEQVARRWERTPVLARQPPDVRKRAHADRLRNTPGGLARALRGLGTGALPSVWDRLGELRMPVVLIAGERDQKYVTIADRMAERIPDARVVVVPGAGHAVHLEAPDIVAHLIAEA
jgi:2-succinyl-6-hydroxy-2,4-cyclohexadiene-1-carboxylate synthase